MPPKTDAVAALSVASQATGVASPSVTSISIAASPTPERRKSPRFLCEGTAKVMVLGGALSFTGRVQDLSLSGCCIVTEVAFTLERGTQVEVVLVVDHTHFRVAAGVRSNHKHRGVGLEFMNISGRSARLIHDLICEIETKQKREEAKQTT
jgi:hypothetical protein